MAEPLIWPLQIWYLMSIISVPAYILVFISLLRLRCCSKVYNTTFYTILVQHSIADLLAMLIFAIANVYKYIPPLKLFVYEHQEYYLPAASYNSIYYFLYIRCCGIVLLSFQRVLIIAAPSSLLTHIVQNAANWQVVLVYWTIPTLLSIVVLKDTDFQYEDYETMSLVVPRDIIKRNTLMALIVVSLTCILCSFFYSTLYIYIRMKTSTLSRNLRREMHLAGQVFVLLLAFFVILVYYSFQNYFSQTQNNGPIFFMRSLYPVANGFLSYINPFCVLFLNREIATQVYQTFRCKKIHVSKVRQISSVNQSQIVKNTITRTL